jgi:hypothetical protein
MFASDQQIAEAIVGKSAADRWVKERLPTLASKPGFPSIDDFHGGRPVELVARFYRQYLGITTNQNGKPDGKEGEWRRSKHRA